MTQSSPLAPLTVTAIVPNDGLTSGASTVTILGTGFQAGAIVTIGEAATHVVLNSSTSLSVVTAAHGAGQVDVVVTNPGGETARLGLAFTYRDPAPPPTITRVEPRTALMTGGAAVRIDGTGFRNRLTLTVGGVGAGYGLFGDTITAYMPAHAPGLVDITVTNDDGQSATLAGALTYLPIEGFDFNGVWEGETYELGEVSKPFHMTIEHDHVVSFTCGTAGVIVLDPAPLIRDGQFAYTGPNGLAIDGVIRTPTEFDGSINAPSCQSTGWYANKK